MNDAVETGARILFGNRMVNNFERNQQNQNRDRVRNSAQGMDLGAELEQQRADGSSTLTAADMQKIVADSRGLPNPTQIIPGSQPGTYIFENSGVRTDPMRIAPEALVLASQSNLFRVDPAILPAPAAIAPASVAPRTPPTVTIDPALVGDDRPTLGGRPVSAPTTTATTPATTATTPATTATTPATTATTPATTPVAAPAARPAPAPTAGPDGSLATRYRHGSDAAPDASLVKIYAGQVQGIQNMLQQAGYPVGDAGADGKWGPQTQRAFDTFCRAHNIAPGTVDFTNLYDPETQTFLKEAKSDIARRGQGASTAPAAPGAAPGAAPAGATTTTPAATASVTTPARTRMGPVGPDDGVAIDADGTSSAAVGRGRTGGALPANTGAPAKGADGTTIDADGTSSASVGRRAAGVANVESVRNGLLAEVQNGVGDKEARVVEGFIERKMPGDIRATDSNGGNLGTREQAEFRNLLNALPPDELATLNTAMRAAKAEDVQAAGARPPSTPANAQVASLGGGRGSA